jgi:hypothetical protein
MDYTKCRDLGFGIDSLANEHKRVRKLLESFDIDRMIDELKEKKAIIIEGKSNIERGWDLSGIDKLMSQRLFS